MSVTKKVFGIFLIVISVLTPFLFSLPIFSDKNNGKIYKETPAHFYFLQKDSHEYVLLFFGYSGCGNICPPALNEISHIYDRLDKNKFKFYFVNLKTSSTQEYVDAYAKAFNKEFTGVYLNKIELQEIINNFHIKYMPSFLNKEDINHSGFLHVLKHENNLYQQKFLYTTRPFDIDFIVKDLNNL